jgi:hypothetical protein
MTSEQARQDHLRLQTDLTQLSTNSRQIMVSSSGHEVYLYQPQVVIHAIAAVVNSAKLQTLIDVPERYGVLDS